MESDQNTLSYSHSSLPAHYLLPSSSLNLRDNTPQNDHIATVSALNHPTAFKDDSRCGDDGQMFESDMQQPQPLADPFKGNAMQEYQDLSGVDALAVEL
ncbi:hypothetical protein FGO68_gene14189 [Halteria grandinella]|uniref:Uncharacterized protein n=1 Tax=Halteria grandinella TaxID=5974 RepID=A0A8J8NHJ1_HALGN|nr:hypothetical protein FGO68_gene14189 [Halteria grandinella]